MSEIFTVLMVALTVAFLAVGLNWHVVPAAIVGASSLYLWDWLWIQARKLGSKLGERLGGHDG